jgi:hypothetical protein
MSQKRQTDCGYAQKAGEGWSGMFRLTLAEQAVNERGLARVVV